MKSHYEFTGETKIIWDKGETKRKLYRIRATQDLPLHKVKKGDLGGWLEKEENLSENAWVDEYAEVYGNAKVYGNAIIKGNAIVCENAKVYEYANVGAWGKIYGNAKVYGEASIYGEARVSDNAKVYGEASVMQQAQIQGNACVFTKAVVGGQARVCENAKVYGEAKVYTAFIRGNACICNKAFISDKVCVFGDGKIQTTNDYYIINIVGLGLGQTIFFKTIDNNIKVHCEYNFFGSLEEFKEEIEHLCLKESEKKEIFIITEIIKIKINSGQEFKKFDLIIKMKYE